MTVAIIEKSPREEIRVTRETFKGHDLVNVRAFYRSAGGEMRPARQGIALRVELVPHVIEALVDALDATPGARGDE